ncbi:hypothetical protein AVEN_245810-1 [Araneus ventricosus]|uniref:Uncharacterized protein n=1 Tax=Araneus ventricosus TaxID=182803 RepID=A0A4Y2EBK4_ARAVE|nr:hypothetical protein AVEN_245810-1 [Araneus ventricosus]
MNNLPRRQTSDTVAPHSRPHCERLMRFPPLQRYDPSSMMVSKSQTIIIIPTREARPQSLIRRLLIYELVVPPGGNYKSIKDFVPNPSSRELFVHLTVREYANTKIPNRNKLDG